MRAPRRHAPGCEHAREFLLGAVGFPRRSTPSPGDRALTVPWRDPQRSPVPAAAASLSEKLSRSVLRSRRSNHLRAHLSTEKGAGSRGETAALERKELLHGVRRDPPRDESGNPVAATPRPGDFSSSSGDPHPAPRFQSAEGGISPEGIHPPPTWARGAAQGGEEGFAPQPSCFVQS